MNVNLSREQYSSPASAFASHPKTPYERLGELIDAGTHEEVQCVVVRSEAPVRSQRKGNVVNTAFADLLLGIRIADEPRQHDAWNLLMRLAWSAAVKSGFVRCSRSGDYEQIALDCLFKEAQKYADLEAYEIVQRHDANMFAYIWKALIADYIDEMRKIRRRREQPVDWDKWTSWELMANTEERDSSLDPGIGKPEEQWNYDSMAQQIQKAANELPPGPAAVAEFLADLLGNSERLKEHTGAELSDTACKTRFVEYVAQSRGVGEQVVRRDVKRFKENLDRPEFAHVIEILNSTLNLPSRRAPQITAPAAQKPELCPLPAEIQARPVWTDEDRNSNSWSSRCPVCNTRLHSEDDSCSACRLEDSANGFQPYCWMDRKLAMERFTKESINAVRKASEVITKGLS